MPTSKPRVPSCSVIPADWLSKILPPLLGCPLAAAFRLQTTISGKCRREESDDSANGRLAQRTTIGVARCGGIGENTSGDLFLAFSTANRGLSAAGQAAGAALSVRMLPNAAMTPLFEAVTQAIEESIVNALCAATTMTGIDGHTPHALPLDRLQEIMRHYRRLS